MGQKIGSPSHPTWGGGGGAVFALVEKTRSPSLYSDVGGGGGGNSVSVVGEQTWSSL